MTTTTYNNNNDNNEINISFLSFIEMLGQKWRCVDVMQGSLCENGEHTSACLA